jgi:hypothetical protein
MADELAAERRCERIEVRDTGQGVHGDGDMCCNVTKRGNSGEYILQARVYAWKVKSTL